MKKLIFKINIFLLSFVTTMPTIICYAEKDPEDALKVISNRILDIISWFAYAIALGAIMFFGIKYMLSGANERANLKGMLPKYLIGFALIVLCFEIASGVAEIAGKDTADEILEVGKEAGDYFSGAGNYYGDEDESATKDPLDQYYEDLLNNNNDVNGDGGSNLEIPEDKPATPEEAGKEFADNFMDAINDFVNNNKPEFDNEDEIRENAQNKDDNIWSDDETVDIINDKKEPQKPPTEGFKPGRPSLDELAGG